jgi:lysophospholipid acyltransferase
VISLRKLKVKKLNAHLFDLKSWNKNTASWLRRSIYVRIVDDQTRNLSRATYLTYLTSALWHGFLPGYYLCFITGSMMTLTGRSLRKLLHNLFSHQTQLHRYKPLYDILGWIGSVFLINYSVMPFYSRSLGASFLAWKSIWFCGHILMMSAMVLPKQRPIKHFFSELQKKVAIKKADQDINDMDIPIEAEKSTASRKKEQ